MNHGQMPDGFNDLTDYYEILDLKPDASPAEIREAYFRTKSTYQKDNVALYTLIDSIDREDMLRRVEEAYQVLSNPDRRREYDRYHGQLSNSPFGAPSSAPAESESAKVISIDRTAPMENVREGENPLEAPRTDTGSRFDTHYAGGMDTTRRTPSAFLPPEAERRTETSQRTETPQPASVSVSVSNKPVSKAFQELEKEISEQTEWSGAFLRRVREARGVSIEEVTQATKITKAYIQAIEEENYGKLPAAVFIRGFVGQIARLLKLPHQQVSASYMSRLQRANPEKFR